MKQNKQAKKRNKLIPLFVILAVFILAVLLITLSKPFDEIMFLFQQTDQVSLSPGQDFVGSDMFNILVGVIVLALGWPIGNLLARATKDEQKQGQIWFKLITILGMVGGLVGLIIGNDVVLFTGFFIAIVASKSIIQKRKKKVA